MIGITIRIHDPDYDPDAIPIARIGINFLTEVCLGQSTSLFNVGDDSNYDQDRGPGGELLLISAEACRL